MSHARRALVALVLIAAVAGQAGLVKADTISDAKKLTGKALGVKPSDFGTCTIFTKSDAERVFHAPVVHLETDMAKHECAYGLAKDPSAGVNVSRATPPLYPPQAGEVYGMKTSQVRHVKGVGQNAYTYYVNAGHGGVYNADVLTSKGVTSVALAERAGNADTALMIARMVMNR